MKDSQNQRKRIILGLKIRELREQQQLTFSELSEKSGLSIAYLNEIERGKKYPKQDKMESLAKALHIDLNILINTEIAGHFAPIADLLRSNFLNDLPLEFFGIDALKVVEMLSKAPSQVGAFIATLMDISNKYALQQEHFYFAALRTYQEMHYNYFEELEIEAQECVNFFQLNQHTKIVPLARLYEILAQAYGYSFERTELMNHPDLTTLRSVFLPQKKRLLVRSDLSETQEAFLLGREIAYNWRQSKNRNYTSTPFKVDSFQQVLENFKAAYFSVALLVHREPLIKDLTEFFQKDRWDATAFIALMQEYQASPEMFFHRLTNLLPQFFGIKRLFFLRFSHTPKTNEFTLTKELHLTRRHQPHGNAIRENYCHRWITLWLLKDLQKLQLANAYLQPIAGAQRSKYVGSDDEYLCLTIARPGHPTPDTNISVTIGLQIDKTLKEKIRFINDPKIPTRTVSQTCERCPITDCEERVAEPSVLRKEAQHENILSILKKMK